MPNMEYMLNEAAVQSSIQPMFLCLLQRYKHVLYYVEKEIFLLQN